ncbi:hypothetical protein CVT24_002208, partial [Panaeolus cyanescens]
MGRPPKEYKDVILLDTTINIPNPNGQHKAHSLYYDRATKFHLIQCPKCRFYFQYTNNSVGPFLRHRGSDKCKKLYKRMMKATARQAALVTVNEDEGGGIEQDVLPFAEEVGDIGEASGSQNDHHADTNLNTTRSSPLPPSSPPPPLSEQSSDESCSNHGSDLENETAGNVGISFTVVHHERDGPGVVLLLHDDVDSAPEDDGVTEKSDEEDMDRELSNPCHGQPFIRKMAGLSL